MSIQQLLELGRPVLSPWEETAGKIEMAKLFETTVKARELIQIFLIFIANIKFGELRTNLG